MLLNLYFGFVEIYHLLKLSTNLELGNRGISK